MGFTSILFWSAWSVAGLLSLLLFHWHREIYPLKSPGVRMGEGGIVILMVMALRWLVMAAAVLVVAAILSRRAEVSAWKQAAWTAGSLGLHLLLGLLNLRCWNRWVSAADRRSRNRDGLLAAAYFLLPVVALLCLAALQIVWCRQFA